MKKLSEGFRYHFDNAMSRGAVALIGLLGLATVVMIIVISGLVLLFRAYPEGSTGMDLVDLFWGSLMRTLDAGTMGGDEGWGFRFFMLLITIGGVIVVASLISIISGAFDAKVEELRKGRSKVLESDHTLILGWNSKIHTIVRELAIANESRGKASIVILAPKDKIEMDDSFHAEKGLGRTRVICRTGDPKHANDLEIVNLNQARSIIVLATENSTDADAETIKTVMAIVNHPERRQDRHNIVAELSSSANLEIARLVGKDETSWVLGDETIARIAVQTCLQPGMSAIYTELLDFGGDEIYFIRQPSLIGRSYFEAQTAFPKCAVMGLVRDEQVEINPVPDTIITPTDQVIVIAEDDSLIRIGEVTEPDIQLLVEAEPPSLLPTHILVLGTNAKLPLILDELDDYVALGSTARIVTTSPVPDLPRLVNLEVTTTRADQTNREVLESLSLATFEHILVLADECTECKQRTDSRTLFTLLQIRDLCTKYGLNLNIVSEMLDDDNRALAAITETDDFIVSDRLTALILAQISENPLLNRIFQVLLTSEDNEIYLNPASDYIQPGCTVDFYTLLEAARRRGETALGYRVTAHAHNVAENYGIRLNPLKSDPINLAPEDRIIVLALGND